MEKLFILEDDWGEWYIGSKEDCLQHIVLWTEDEASEGAYPEEELKLINEYFSQDFGDVDYISYYGFSISPYNN